MIVVDMSAAVRLNDIVEALEMQLDETAAFLNLDTGQVEIISEDLLGDAEEADDEEEMPDLPEWQKRDWEVARQIVSTDRFKKLPSKFDVHESAIMRDFANSPDSGGARQDLLRAIHGAGAFRMFKDTLRRRNLESAWFAFRAEALRQIAIEWCEEKHVAWE
jgi:Uncharacterised protein family (UPF0158)